MTVQAPASAISYRVHRLGSGAGDALQGIHLQGGCVLSTFERAANLCAGNGRLLALHGPDVAMTPFSACLDTVPARWPAVGTPVTVDGCVLQVGALQCWLPGAADQLPAPRDAGQAGPGGAYDWAMAAAALEPWAAGSAFGCWWQPEAPTRAGTAGAMQTVSAQRLRGLVTSVRQSDAESTWQTTRALLGLGTGLTPSGDDMLLGLLGTWRYLAPSTLRFPLAERLLARVAALAPSSTTPVSAELFYHLVRDRRSEPFDALLIALESGEGARLHQAAGAMARWGHTSGRDCLAGVLALVLAARETPPPW